MTNKSKTITCDDALLTLSYGADLRYKAQKKFDLLARRYERLQTELSIQAQGEAVIPTGKPDEYRLPSNEADRKLAAKLVCQQSTAFCRLEAQYQAAQRQLQYYTDQQANFRVIAELLAHGEITRPF